MNVAIAIDTLNGGGAEGVVRRLSAGLARRGHDVFVYCLKQAGVELDELAAAGVVVREARSVGRDPGLALRLGRWLRADGIEVVHAHNCAALVWLTPAARLLGLPLLHVHHGGLMGRPSRYRRIALLLDRWVDRLLVVAESDRRWLPSGRARREALYVPNGIDLPQVPPHEARAALETLIGRTLSGPVVLGVGSICAEKDVHGLLRAFSSVIRRRPDARLIWLGAPRDAAYAAEAERLVEALGLSEFVSFPGRAEQAWRLMAGADVFCLSSATEAFPNVVLEAMSQAVPIVATTAGDVGRLSEASDRDMLRNGMTGLLAPPGDPGRLAARLLEALRDRSAAVGRATAAQRDQALRFSLDRMVRGYESAYAGVARQRQALPSRGRSCVLMVGPDASQVGGVSGVIDSLTHGALAQRIEVRRLAHSSGETTHRPSVFDRLRSLARHMGDLSRLAGEIRRSRPKIVHIHTASGFTFFRSVLDACVARMGGRRAVLHIHGGRFHEFCRAAGPFKRRIIGWAARTADALIVLSPRWERLLAPFLSGIRIEVVPNAASSDFSFAGTGPRRAARGNSCHFVFLGALRAEKGVHDLLRAAEALAREGIEFRLTLAGPGDETVRERLILRVEQSELGGKVRVLPAVLGRAKTELLNDADCLVLPSYSEAMPLVILEAAAAGRAVIATRVGDVPELLAPVADAPIAPLIAAGDVDGLTGAMRRFAEQAEEREAVAVKLREHVRRNYSDASQARRLVEVYRSLSRPRRRMDERISGGVIHPLHEWLRGRRTQRYLAEMRQIASGDVVTAQDVTRRRLSELLRFCEERLPYYRELFARQGVDLQKGDPVEALIRMPVLDKADVRRHAEGMVWRDAPGGVHACSSGGTTGDPLHFLIDRDRQARPLAARLFMQERFGIRAGDRRAYLWGSPIECARSSVRRWRDRLLNEIVLNAFEMSPAQMDAHLHAIRRFGPRLVYAYPSAAALLARHAMGRSKTEKLKSVELVVLTGEEVTDAQRALVSEAFGCRVASEYGSREVGLIAHECPSGGMHVMASDVLVEVLRDGRRAKPGTFGDVVCTTLTTRAQPFVRYRLGDVGALVAEACGCGLPLPCIRLAGGKVTGMIALRDGRLCHGAVTSHVLREERGIIEFKTHQRSVELFEVWLVTGPQFDPAAPERIARRYRELFGEQVRVECRVVDRIPPDPSGKRRYVVSDVAEAAAEAGELTAGR